MKDEEHYIKRKWMRSEIFIEEIAAILTSGKRCVTWVPNEGVFYTFGGWWRIQPVFKTDDDKILAESLNGFGDEDFPGPCLIGARLINPSKKREEIIAVEKGIQELIGG